jgi:hypothetical protein
VFVCVGLAPLLLATPPLAQGAVSLQSTAEQARTEYEVKAASISLFITRYIKWPEKDFPDKQAPFVVAVLGKDPFGKSLSDALKNKKFGTHPVELVAFEDIEALKECHLLFVPEDSDKQLPELLKFYKGKSTLLVGESLSIAESGVSIGCWIENARIRFAINNAAAKRAKLELSSELLKLAKPVEDKAGKKP